MPNLSYHTRFYIGLSTKKKRLSDIISGYEERREGSPLNARSGRKQSLHFVIMNQDSLRSERPQDKTLSLPRGTSDRGKQAEVLSTLAEFDTNSSSLLSPR